MMVPAVGAVQRDAVGMTSTCWPSLPLQPPTLAAKRASRQSQGAPRLFGAGHNIAVGLLGGCAGGQGKFPPTLWGFGGAAEWSPRQGPSAPAMGTGQGWGGPRGCPLPGCPLATLRQRALGHGRRGRSHGGAGHFPLPRDTWGRGVWKRRFPFRRFGAALWAPRLRAPPSPSSPSSSIPSPIPSPVPAFLPALPRRRDPLRWAEAAGSARAGVAAPS